MSVICRNVEDTFTPIESQNGNAITICGVNCYEENGVAYLRLEDVARVLGFTQEKNGNQYVRWEAVYGY